ncbi:unnamed protein product [Moneuplotes crassus]|uniref:Uncharacterized protein n=1 Tax=Euplotes crassus TaxID=5936 RepID=A0AAD1XP65_EUPCR|nr:unnamed protein product [Moneuplotes crassus]
MNKIMKNYKNLELVLNKEVENQKKKHCSPLFKEHEQEFMTLNTSNQFYGYRTTLQMEKKVKNSLLTVSNTRNKRPQTSRGDYLRDQQKGKPFRNRDVMIKKRRPMSAIREDIGAKRQAKKSIETKKGSRPVTALSSFQKKKLPGSPQVPGLQISSPNRKVGKFYSTLKSSRNKAKAKKPTEVTSSFWDDGFSFRNRTLGSQNSLNASASPPRKKHRVIQLVRQSTKVIGRDTVIHHGNIEMSLHELRSTFKLKHEQRNELALDSVVFSLGIEENCPQIHCDIIGPAEKQIGRFVIKKNLGTMTSKSILERAETKLTKNLLAKMDFHDITVEEMCRKPSFKIQIGSKMGLRGWNSIKNILKYGEFEFFIDFSAHKEFDRIRLSDSGIKEFMYGIEGCSTLKHLNIKENNITANGMEVIKNYLPKTSVINLNISHNPLGNEGIIILSKLLMTYKFKLLELDISACEFNQVGAMSIYNCLRNNVPLETLHMNENKLRGPTMKYFTDAMWQNTNLKKLSIASSQLDYQCARRALEALENNTGLYAVNLSNNNITEQHSDNLANVLCSNESRLKYINLSDNYLTDESLEDIDITDNLRSLILRNNSLKNEGALILLTLLHEKPNLRRVDLRKNMVSIKYLNDITNLIQAKNDLRERQKLQSVRQEIIDTNEELKTMPIVQKEIRVVLKEKERYLKELNATKVEKEEKIKEQNNISKVVDDQANEIRKLLRSQDVKIYEVNKKKNQIEDEYYKKVENIQREIIKTKGHITRMYKEKDALNKTINEKSKEIKEELFNVNLKYENVNAVKKRAQGTMDSFASQIDFIKKEIEKLKQQKAEKHQKKLLLMNKIKTTPNTKLTGLKTKRSGRSRKRSNKRSKLKKPENLIPIKSATELPIIKEGEEPKSKPRKLKRRRPRTVRRNR